MPGRPVRAYRAVLSTEADALAWARAGGPDGGVVAAGYQAAPRGRGGTPWSVDHQRDLCFSLLLRPTLAPQREGWVYTAVASGVADVVGEDAEIRWPDEVHLQGVRRAAVALQVGLGAQRVEWAVANIWVVDAPPPRARFMARTVEAVISSLGRPATELLADYRRRCETVGKSVRARLAPLGSAGDSEVSGRAAALLKDGTLVIETSEGRRLAVRPQHLMSLEDLP